ncbi:DUF2179 domain-containing protein [Ammoniphilus sp. 3BR4]|uniref:DUF2179 domain-containing protein n=1 Tax=Ammoniphilus sp. 3BR4 TaxID=3158265 RepID=UPI003465BC24
MIWIGELPAYRGTADLRKKSGLINHLKNLVQETDPGACVIVTEANEILGEGFKRY